jgi:hypothetical protein
MRERSSAVFAMGLCLPASVRRLAFFRRLLCIAESSRRGDEYLGVVGIAEDECI